MKKIICIILSILTLFTLVACQPAEQPIETPASEESSTPEASGTPAEEVPDSEPESIPGSDTEPEETNPSETEPEETEPDTPASYLKINGVDISEYTFIYPKKQANNYAEFMNKFAEHVLDTFKVNLTFMRLMIVRLKMLSLSALVMNM